MFFQKHAEEKHNQTYSIQRDTYLIKSPPTKRIKEHHVVYMDTDSLNIFEQKDEEIMHLKSTINLLKQKLKNVEDTGQCG